MKALELFLSQVLDVFSFSWSFEINSFSYMMNFACKITSIGIAQDIYSSCCP